MAHQLCAAVGRLAVALAIFTVLSSASLVQDQQPVTQEAAKNMASLPINLLEEADTPQNVQSATSILQTVSEAFSTQLHAEKGQRINGLLALVFGLVLLIDGDFTFKWVVLGGTFCAAVLFAQNEAAAVWGYSSESGLRHVVGLEVGACVAFVTYRGYEGLLLALSAALGSFIAHSVEQRLGLWGCVFLQKPWVLFTWYSLFILGFMALVGTKKYIKVLGFFTSALGGALVSSALSFFVTTTQLSHGSMKFVSGAWVDFFLLLCVPGSKDVGILTSYGRLSETWPMDRVFGCLLWGILFLVGFVVQSKRESARAQAGTNHKTDANEPLLP